MAHVAQHATPTSSASKLKHLTSQSDIIPLDSPLRTVPLHPSIPSIKLPASAADADSQILNPLTLKPFTLDDLKTHNYAALKEQYSLSTSGPADAKKAQEEALRELKERVEDSEKRTRDIEREMDAKEKLRDMERRIYAKKLGKDGAV